MWFECTSCADKQKAYRCIGCVINTVDAFEATIKEKTKGGNLCCTYFSSRTPSVFLSFFLYNALSFPLYFPGKTAWKSSNFGL